MVEIQVYNIFSPNLFAPKCQFILSQYTNIHLCEKFGDLKPIIIRFTNMNILKFWTCFWDRDNILQENRDNWLQPKFGCNQWLITTMIDYNQILVVWFSHLLGAIVLTQNLTKVILFVPETEALEGGLDRFNEIEKKIFEYVNALTFSSKLFTV